MSDQIQVINTLATDVVVGGDAQQRPGNALGHLRARTWRRMLSLRTVTASVA